jgi:hypothetical protein
MQRATDQYARRNQVARCVGERPTEPDLLTVQETEGGLSN